MQGDETVIDNAESVVERWLGRVEQVAKLPRQQRYVRAQELTVEEMSTEPRLRLLPRRARRALAREIARKVAKEAR